MVYDKYIINHCQILWATEAIPAQWNKRTLWSSQTGHRVFACNHDSSQIQANLVANTAEQLQHSQLLERAITDKLVTTARDVHSASSHSSVTVSSSVANSQAEDDFFNYSTNAFHNSGLNHCQAYLADKDTNITMLSRHPIVKDLFLRFNTKLPSSAPVERLFSTAAIILTKRRNRLSDGKLEKYLMLRQNGHLIKEIVECRRPRARDSLFSCCEFNKGIDM